MSDYSAEPGYLPGQLLIAMPNMSDPRFERSVIYLCAHSADGAMGLVVNKLIESLTFPELLEQLGIDLGPKSGEIRVHFGGPVESGRGFVLHSDDYLQDSTMVIDDGIALTATIDVLKDVSNGRGPDRAILALGYAGWGPGQLDAEIMHNGWLHAPADPDILFAADIDRKWDRAIRKIGIDPSMLTMDAGHA
jgi:putative transcriptional regulator